MHGRHKLPRPSTAGCSHYIELGEDARKYLLPLLDGLHCALDELHQNNIAHLDVPLPNICFDEQSRSVVLIDADRCDKADRLCTCGIFTHHLSDMYKPPLDYQGERWTNRHADMRSVGMMVCFILDSQLDSNYYHEMISQNSINNVYREEPFTNQLLNSGV